MKQKISSILVPYNGTASSDKAFKNVLNFAQNNCSTVILYICIKERFSFGFFKTKNDKKILKKEKEIIQRKIENLKKLPSSIMF